MTDKDKDATTEEKNSTIAMPLEWHIPDGIATPFATNMIIQVIENEFKISFFEAKPFIRFDDSQPLPKTVRADCVASVIVTADRLPKFITAMQSQLDKYNTKKQNA